METKNLFLRLGILIFLAIVAGAFILFQKNNKTEPAIQPITKSSPLSNCVHGDLIQVDSDLNINLDKSGIFDGIYTFLKLPSDQKEARVLKLKVRRNGKILNLENLCSELDIGVPDNIAEKIGDYYTLMGFFSQLENREWELKSLGLAMEINSEEEAIKENLREWEKTMAEDVIPLALVKNKKSLPFKEFEGNKFQDGSYKNIAIRYSELPLGWRGEAVDYIFTDDKIFIATSRKSIYAVIDLL